MVRLGLNFCSELFFLPHHAAAGIQTYISDQGPFEELSSYSPAVILHDLRFVLGNISLFSLAESLPVVTGV